MYKEFNPSFGKAWIRNEGWLLNYRTMMFLSLLSKHRIGRRNGSKSYTNSSNTELQLRHFILSMLMWVKLCAFHGRLTAQKSSLRKEASLSNWSVGSPHRQSKLKSGRDPRNAVFIFVFKSSTLHIFCWTLDYFAYNSSLYYLQHKELKL